MGNLTNKSFKLNSYNYRVTKNRDMEADGHGLACKKSEYLSLQLKEVYHISQLIRRYEGRDLDGMR